MSQPPLRAGGQRAPSHLKLKLFTEEKNCLPNYIIVRQQVGSKYASTLKTFEMELQELF